MIDYAEKIKERSKTIAVNAKLSYVFKIAYVDNLVAIYMFWNNNNIPDDCHIIAGIIGEDDPGYNCLRNVGFFKRNISKKDTRTVIRKKSIPIPTEIRPLWNLPSRFQTKIKLFYNWQTIKEHKIPLKKEFDL